MPEAPAAALWTSDEIIAAAGGRLMGRAFDVTGVSIDTRTLEKGDLFVALKGERDGHAFARSAFEKGAAGALVSQPVDGPHIEVGDTQIALEQLGVAARERCRARRGAVTGSVGKTSVTQALKAGLELAGRSHGSVKSYNNQIGVPLTLARMPRDTERAVFEIGMNHSGEIEPLSKMVRPHAVTITTVGPVHVENFPDGETGVARAKAEIFAGLEPGGVAVLNADDRWFDLLKAEAARVGGRVRTFGHGDGCDAQVRNFRLNDGGSVVRARLYGRDLDIALAQTAPHWAMNGLCVLLMLEALGVDFDTGLAALADFEPLAGRGSERSVPIPGGAFVLVDESYNANPISMRAAISTLGARPGAGRKLAVLTDMLELGPDGPERHAELADQLEAAGVDLVFCAGPLMKSLWDALPAASRAGYARTAEELSPEVLAAVEPGDVVMVKGSNGSRAGLIAAALAKGGTMAMAQDRKGN
jgi:UDP-N-acetylmuramoyl-tripeptide--D-alanyl-D-alanine ligase